MEQQSVPTKPGATEDNGEESKQYNLRKRNNIMPYVDGESDEEDFIYEPQIMVGHETKRPREDDESYEEDEKLR